MAEIVVCAVCGQPIQPNESRFVDVRKGARVQVHRDCKAARDEKPQ
jgi:hypothetical protein